MDLNFFRFITLFSSLTLFPLAIFIFIRNRSSSIHRSFAAFVLLCATWVFGFFLTMFSQVPYSFALWSSRLSQLFGFLTPIAFLNFVVTLIGFKKEAKVHHIHWIMSSVVPPIMLSSFGVSAVPKKLFFPYYPEAGLLYIVLLVPFVFTYGSAFKLLYQEARNSNYEPSQRQSYATILIAVLLAWVSVATLFLPIYNVYVTPQLYFFPLIGIATIYVILRYQFLDIRIILRRSLVYSTLVAGITLINLMAILVMERWFEGIFGYRSVLASLMVAVLIAISFTPLRDWLQRQVDRSLFSATPAELAAQKEQLLAHIRQGEQLKAVGTLAAGLAHEIKNPLASIKTFTEYLDTKYTDPEFREKFKRIVGGEVERMNLIVQQLLEFAKPSPPKLVAVEVPRLLDDTLELLNNDLLQRKVRVIRSYAPTPPVLGDSQQLKQVFLNLLLNSLQAMNGSGQLTLKTDIRGSELEITIQDNGHGIPAEDLPHIFGPFFSTKPTGTGLGLAVVQGIVKEHGGRIQITSEFSKGTTVSVMLPKCS